GVSGIDAALLVVAADDGVMPQTREHFEILKLLDIKIGAIAINKVDLADDDWLELVELDVQELVEGSFLENAPIHKVSALNNMGMDELKNELIQLAESVPEKISRGMFRLPVDRVFSIKGFGTVVTGTVSSGQADVGDTIEILPGHKKAKIRGIQTHDSNVDSIQLGARAAINLQGIEADELERGCQVATPNYFQNHFALGTKVSLLSSSKHPMVQNQRVRIHLATQEVMARVALPDRKSIEPGDDGPVIFRLESPLVASMGDKFIIRLYSPVITIGGGEIIETELSGKWKDNKEKITHLYKLTDDEKFQFRIESEAGKPITKSSLGLRLGLSTEKIENIVSENSQLKWIKYKTSTWLVTIEQINSLSQNLIKFLTSYHKKNPYKSGAQKEEIRQFLKADEYFCDYFLQLLSDESKIKSVNDRWALCEFSIQLSEIENKLLQNLITILNAEGFTSSRYDELANKLEADKEKVLLLLNIAEQRGDVLRLDESLMFTRGNFSSLREKVVKFFEKESELSVSQFKDLADTSRKYAVPLLEYFDKQKITYRDGNCRKLA
ncbi:MAG: selenocysteine-specific translation elongation factor, partial [Candidatus Marinimicrobia bacterium]|nr:selenocysteine-specific translation elongation factor [Candidatus Neomarinimicrobiota bacterium]